MMIITVSLMEDRCVMGIQLPDPDNPDMSFIVSLPLPSDTEVSRLQSDSSALSGG